jgi:MoxR-like ATPase
MALKLTDGQIELLCRELLARETLPSGRLLRRALRERYGAVGRTDRIYAIWRRLNRGDTPLDAVTDPERQRWIVRIAAAEERARLAEEREIKHQDRWASELYALREQLRTRQGSLASGVSHDVYHRVHQELLQVRGELERLKQETGKA